MQQCVLLFVLVSNKAASGLMTSFGPTVKNALEGLYLKPYYSLEKTVASRSMPKLERPRSEKLSFGKAKSDDDDDDPQQIDHSLWQGVLSAHVREGVVDYDGLRSDARFDAYLELLAANEPEAPFERLAYALNAYNALCANFVVRNPGITSILDLSTKEAGPVWDQPAGELGGKTVSLNDVEHKWLRDTWDDPRIHACIVCASKSCPPLSQRAFVGDDEKTLDDAMDTCAKTWVSDTTKGCHVDADRRKITLSRIFLWFEDDFEFEGGPLHFCGRWRDDLPATQEGGWAIRYFDYDWSLNAAAASSVTQPE
mmetsp:Transcript_19268/g.61958  ORF Transcript_19268/g.61958 Transcript_19268/m.61958 type:complete len:311 (+) Transcript_19268:1-933(+)